MPVWQNMHHGRSGTTFLENLKSDADVGKAMTAGELEALFDLAYHLKHADTIFKRVFESS
jgi:adenylosuccinate lyase